MLDEENEETPIVDDGNGEVPTEEVLVEETPNDETPSIITVEELKKRLRLAGIDYSKYTDEDLSNLIDLTLEEIEAETGLPITYPRLIVEYEDLFRGKVYETDFYPIECCEIRLDDELLEDVHRIDLNRGIFYFRPSLTGDLEVKYRIQYTNTTVLVPLITDMIILGIEGDPVHGVWNSVREGDVSVTYGNSSGGLQEKTNEALNRLKGYYKPRIRLL